MGHNGVVKNWLLGRRTPLASAPDLEVDEELRHIVLVGGSLIEWQDLGAEAWSARVDDLGKAAKSLGARFVSVFPFGPFSGDETVDATTFERRTTIDGVAIVVVPVTDGRKRICDVLASSGATSLTEHDIDDLIFGESGEPDLVVVLGSPDLLPSSLVWELAYSEIVFVDSAWNDFSVDHIVRAGDEYHSRHRRFGGVDA